MGQIVGCVKYVLFIFNFCLWLLGCALLSVGIWMKVDGDADHFVQRMSDLDTDKEYQINYSATGNKDLSVTLSYLLIVFGIILIAITFIGCCGAVRENMCLLGAFAVCLFALMVALLCIGTWAFIRKDNLNTHTDELRNQTDANLNKGISFYYRNDISKQFVDSVQKRFRCCGSDEARRDYKGRVPETCEPNTYSRGCNYYYFWYIANEVKEFLKKRYTVIGALSIGVALCMVLGIACSILLCILIRRDTRLVVT
ncbi:unnamed protein product [Candidula unifasciata]|uniref:Tetraspanin n=1 Tax=Candidula unifasciata TaxID=100452 RepID=A0A8S4A333_9EUPU|nr:unnamed protein product [Candidula unifasciata]